MIGLVLAVSLLDPAAVARFDVGIEALEAQRQSLADAYRTAGSAQRRAIRDEARAAVVGAIRGRIFPAWMGMPWGLGKNSTARRPFEPGKVVGCSYFVTSVLQNAGLALSNRYHFAQAPALEIQRSLAPARGDVHRFFSIPPAELSRRVAALGDGLYVIGLNNHVGFVDVHGGRVDVVHASYNDDQVVIAEPLAEAQVIANSQKAGYFVSPIFQDDRLVDHWLKGRAVPFEGRRPR